jgi:tRNA1Val (adenine37-N6)-methyltransferase
VTATRSIAEECDTLDAALGGKVYVYQPRKGYRFSVDAILLARFAAEVEGEMVVDLGCGGGVVGLCMLRLSPGRTLLGLEIQEAFVARAIRAVKLNDFDGKASFRCADISKPGQLGKAGVADIVVSNPPYRQVGEGRLSPDPSVAIARHEVRATLRDVVGAAAYLLKRGGSFCAIYPAFRLDELIGECRRQGLAPHTLRTIHSTADGNATLALLRAEKGGRGTFSVVAPLILHPQTDRQEGKGDKYSEEAIRLLGGEDIDGALAP